MLKGYRVTFNELLKGVEISHVVEIVAAESKEEAEFKVKHLRECIEGLKVEILEMREV